MVWHCKLLRVNPQTLVVSLAAQNGSLEIFLAGCSLKTEKAITSYVDGIAGSYKQLAPKCWLCSNDDMLHITIPSLSPLFRFHLLPNHANELTHRQTRKPILSENNNIGRLAQLITSDIVLTLHSSSTEKGLGIKPGKFLGDLKDRWLAIHRSFGKQRKQVWIPAGEM